MATELLSREQKIMKLQHIIEEQRENEKIMYKLLYSQASCYDEMNYTSL